MSVGSFILELKRRKFRLLRLLLGFFLFFSFAMPRLMNATNDLDIWAGLVLAFFFVIWVIDEVWSLVKLFVPRVQDAVEEKE